MGIELYFSNHLEVLFNCLQINLQASDKHFSDILNPDKIIVLNSHTTKWLQLNLAKQNRVIANTKFCFLEQVLWEQLEFLNDSREAIDFLNKDKLRVILYEILRQDNNEELAILIKFISFATSESMKISRVWILAEKIASLLMEYEYQRPDMIDAWLSGKFYLTEEYRDIERAQRYLYLLVLQPKTGLLQTRKTPSLSLYHYFKKVFSKPIKKKHTDKPIHLFAISQISIFHQQILSKLKEYFDYHIYAFNPCFELWEDILSSREEMHLRKVNRTKQLVLQPSEIEAGVLLEPNKDNALLKAWGKTGREYTKLMSRLVDYQFFPGFIPYIDDLKKESVLQRVKRHILYRIDGSGEKRLPSDNSIQIFSAPSKIREVQTVFHNVLYQLQTQPNLQMHEIAILTTSLDSYKTAILSVFEGAKIPLRFGLAGKLAVSDSLWAKGLLSLLTIARGSFNRREIFNFLQNPCVMAKFNYSDYQYNAWLNLADELNMFQYYDSNDKLENGYLKDSFYTWRQGLVRLRMGKLFGDSHESNFNVYPEYSPCWASSDSIDVDLFVLLIENIERVNSQLKTEKQPKEWVTLLNEVSKEMLDVPKDYPEEERYRMMLTKQLYDLELFNDISLQLGKASKLNLKLVYEYLVSSLAISDTRYSGFMNGGIVVSELQPMRPFPFKITYVLGLGGDEFPGRDISFPLDLRAYKRRIGDISNSDRNRYLILENLLSTSERLYLSWVNKNLVTDQEKSASSVILQLIRYLERNVIEEKEFTIHAMPLHFFQIFELKNLNSNICDLYQNYSKSDYELLFKQYKFYERNASQKGEPLKNKTVVAPSVSVAPKEAADVVKLRFRNIQDFLAFPASSYLSYKLQQPRYDENRLIEDIEYPPLSIGNIQNATIQDQILIRYFEIIKAQNQIIPIETFLPQIVGQLYVEQKNKSSLAKDAFSKYMIENYIPFFNSRKKFYEELAALILKSDTYITELHFGKVFTYGTASARFIVKKPPLAIEVDEIKFLVQGKLEILWFSEKRLYCYLRREVKKELIDLIPFVLLLHSNVTESLPFFDEIIIITDKRRYFIKRTATDWNKLINNLLHLFIDNNFIALLSGQVGFALKDQVTEEEFQEIYEKEFFKTFLESAFAYYPNYLKLQSLGFLPNMKIIFDELFAYTQYINDGQEV